ncbi:M3 family metallopeptidase [Aliiglaciecola litoralis]|uniref:M3 family metallopeptidase n=1 Tax=Aliiglaciecola litoralis TaxID=582857 RepID=A0ABN1LEV0_9ALTE
MKPVYIAALAALFLTACQPQESAQAPATDAAATSSPNVLIDGIDSSLSGEQFTALCDDVMEKAQSAFRKLETDTGPATLESVVGVFDQITYDLQPIRHAWYMKAVHPDESVREAATQCSQRYSDFSSQVGLSRGYYERLAAIDLSTLSATDRYMVEQGLASFKRAGVDKDQATRDKIRALRKEITEIGNQFDKNIRDDVRYVTTTVDKLTGLPQDYLDARPADENGLIKISTDYPDINPILSYAENDDLRKQLRIASRSRGYPQNQDILKTLIKKRHELANLLGFENFAALSMDDKMIGSPENADAFLTKVGLALAEPVKKELDILLARLKKIDPQATQVQTWQVSYLMNLIRQEDYALDSKEVREYFQYDKVRDGILQLTEDLFAVEIRPWKTQTWHEDVETYEIVENGQIIGRFYMDNHPRDNKYKHAAHWGLRSGIKDKQIALSGLAQNFPKGLMEHGQVETFLHEFGHLIHNIFSGNQKWFAITGMSMERDFVEAPSQMLEEWIWDYDTLKKFAVNKEGETIPKALVDKMVKARDFGMATNTATQIYYANLSLNYYNREPDSFELEPLMVKLAETFSPYPHVDGTHFYAAFGHLNGYSSNYYTYQWSLAIATDLFSKFKEAGMRNQKVAAEYRDKVLGAAGSKPAAAFVEDFLGRPFSPDAYIDKLKSL